MTHDFALSRRTLLKTAGAAGATASLGAAVGPRIFSPAIAGPAPKVRLAWTEVAACHSPLAFGVAVLDWLKPLEQGFDVKLFVGSHGGCQRLMATPESGITRLEDLKGKTIVSYGPGSPPKIAFEVTLAKAGFDSERDVTWLSAPFELVGETAHRGDAQAVAHLDPWAYALRKRYGLVELADTQTGVYQDRVCCVLGANGPFLEANKDAVRRVAAANLEIHDYTAAHPDEVAQWYFDNLKPGMLVADLRDDLASLVFHNHPVGQALTDQIQASIEDLKLTKVIDPSTDAADLARHVTIDILA